jgi:hypothetical protein
LAAGYVQHKAGYDLNHQPFLARRGINPRASLEPAHDQNAGAAAQRGQAALSQRVPGDNPKPLGVLASALEAVRGDAEYDAWCARAPTFGISPETATEQNAIEITSHAEHSRT